MEGPDVDARLNLLLESFRDSAILRLDDAGAITSWDANAERLFGHRAPDAAGLSLADLYTSEDVAAGLPNEHLSAARAAGLHEGEGWRRRADGSRMWATVALSVVQRDDEGGGGFTCVVRDVTQRRQAEEELRATEEGFRLLVDSVRDYAIFMLDRRGRISTWNAGAARTLGYAADEVVGRHWSILHVARDVELGSPADHLDQALAEGRCEVEGWRARSDGSVIWASVTVAPLRRADGSIRGFSCVMRDMTERRRFEAELAHRALHDPLTSLPNRELLKDRLGHALARSQRDLGSVGVIFLDLDDFKKVNDSMGHSAGDELLVLLAGRLRSAVRAGDTVARFSGDEFVALCERLSGEAEAAAVAERMIEALEPPFHLAAGEVRAAASAGVAVARPARPCTADSLLRDADTALYAAKRRGKGHHEMFDEEMRSRTAERLGVERDLRAALGAGALHVHYQPVVEIPSGRLLRVEALVRWHHPERGPVSPADFIPVAEESGLIGEVGAVVLADACRVVREWGGQGGDLSVAINVSPAQLADRNFVAGVADALASSGIHPSSLCIEITESVLMDAALSAGLLLELSSLGVRIAIDDFGTGYSSLSYLRRFPVAVLKIDGTFVEHLESGASDRAIVAAMVGMGHALGLEVIAEGVETEAQLVILAELGCDAAQGFLFSPARPAAELPALVERLPEVARSSVADAGRTGEGLGGRAS